MDESELPAGEIGRLTGRFASDEWKYGRTLSFDYELSRRFGWGDTQLQLHVDHGTVLEAAAYSDAMDPDFIAQLPEALIGCRCSREGLLAAVDRLAEKWRKTEAVSVEPEEGVFSQMLTDIKALIAESF